MYGNQIAFSTSATPVASPVVGMADLDSLRQHVVPDWFEDAKFGIFIHWGLFSVPAFAAELQHVSDAFAKHYDRGVVMTPYTEWYDNALRVEGSPSAQYHAERYADQPYENFRDDFSRGLEEWQPEVWARLFRSAGARYVVLVTKHHDGYCLWPSRIPNPKREGWTAERDIVGELAAAVRAEGLRFGIYYSGGIDWSWNPRPVRTLGEFVGSAPRGHYPAYAEAQIRELIDRYAPSVLWNDISWPGDLASMTRLMSDYYEAVPEGVINDRWMHRGWAMRLLSFRPVTRLIDAFLKRAIQKSAARGEEQGGVVPPKPAHFDFRTPEYTTFKETMTGKWEATRGMSPSFGYNQAHEEPDYEPPDALLYSFIDTVSKNGNLLLNVGPRGKDSSIPEPQTRRLELIGKWLSSNGEAIYETRPWQRAEGETQGGLSVRFTKAHGNLYVILLGTPDGQTVELTDLKTAPGTEVTYLPTGSRARVAPDAEGLSFKIEETWAPFAAHAFRISPSPDSRLGGTFRAAR
jgi:alpha-L-fucosidase